MQNVTEFDDSGTFCTPLQMADFPAAILFPAQLGLYGSCVQRSDEHGNRDVGKSRYLCRREDSFGNSYSVASTHTAFVIWRFFVFAPTILCSIIKMTVRLLELHKRYMQDGLFDDPNFTNSIVDESVVDKQWTLRRSYTHEGHTREEHFDIQLFDEDNIPHVRCSLRLVTRGHEALQDDIRWKIFKPGMWIGPQLYVWIAKYSDCFTDNAIEKLKRSNSNSLLHKIC